MAGVEGAAAAAAGAAGAAAGAAGEGGVASRSASSSETRMIEGVNRRWMRLFVVFLSGSHPAEGYLTKGSARTNIVVCGSKTVTVARQWLNGGANAHNH